MHASNGPARGFTLVELLITVAILGVLATIAMANLFGAVERARQSRSMASMRSVAHALAAYQSDNGIYPVVDLAGLASALGDRELQTSDGWKSPFVFTCTTEHYSLRSYGRDRAAGPADITPETRNSFDNDLVMVDGAFTASPQ